MRNISHPHISALAKTSDIRLVKPLASFPSLLSWVTSIWLHCTLSLLLWLFLTLFLSFPPLLSLSLSLFFSPRLPLSSDSPPSPFSSFPPSFSLSLTSSLSLLSFFPQLFFSFLSHPPLLALPLFSLPLSPPCPPLSGCELERPVYSLQPNPLLLWEPGLGN